MKLAIAISAIASLTFLACEHAPAEIAAPARFTPPPRKVLSVADAEVVMSGLNNPRGLAFGPEGALYVAEAGRGGSGPCFVTMQVVCYGPTGAVGRFWKGRQDTVVTGLPSYANAGRAEGPNSIAFHGVGGAYVTIGLETDPRVRVQAPELAGFARLVHVSATAFVPTSANPRAKRAWEYVADAGAYEVDVNPDCGRIDSNPFGVLAIPGGVIIVDAGANALIKKNANHELTTFAAFTSRYTTSLNAQCPTVPSNTSPRETVPTSVTVGPDGAYYVGQLAGFPVVPGAASVYRVVPGMAPTVAHTGFTFIISLAFDSSDNLYVLQHVDAGGGMATGSLIRVRPDGTRTTVIAGLVRATAVAIGDDGAIYISHRGTSVGTGEVLRIRP
jgi:sugar lactone lactonase YvrE